MHRRQLTAVGRLASRWRRSWALPRLALSSAAPLATLGVAYGLFVFRSATLTAQSLWLDEVDTLTFATQDLSQFLAAFSGPAQNGPLYFLVMRLWVALAGGSEFALRYSSLLPSVLLVPLTYALGARLGGKKLGLVGMLLVGCSPYLHWFGTEAKMYALMACLCLLSTYSLLRASASARGGWWITYGVVGVFGLYVHLFFVFLLVFHALAFLLLERLPWRFSWWLPAPTAVLALGFLPLSSWEVPALLYGHESVHRFVPLHEMVGVLALRFALHREGWEALPLLLPFVLLICFWLASLLGKAPGTVSLRKGQGWLALYVLVPVLAFFLISWRVPGFMHRYFIFIVPAVYLLLAGGLLHAWRWRPAAGGLLALSVAGLWAWSYLNPAEERTDYRSAAAYVQRQTQPGDGIGFLAGYAERGFRYYERVPLPRVTLPYANGYDEHADLEARLAGATSGVRRLWLVEHEEWMWDASGRTRAWLERRGRLVASRPFAGMKVSAYALTRAD